MPTGLELMQAMLVGDAPRPPMSAHFPMTLTEVDDGRVVFEGHANETHLNVMGGVHGGFAATILDTVCGCAVMTSMPEGMAYATTDLAIKMMRAVPVDAPLIAEGRVQKPGRRVAFSEGWLRTADGKLLAHATCTCAVFSRLENV